LLFERNNELVDDRKDRQISVKLISKQVKPPEETYQMSIDPTGLLIKSCVIHMPLHFRRLS